MKVEKQDISLAIWKAFRAGGIEFPFPQREVRLLNAGELAAAKTAG